MKNKTFYLKKNLFGKSMYLMIGMYLLFNVAMIINVIRMKKMELKDFGIYFIQRNFLYN